MSTLTLRAYNKEADYMLVSNWMLAHGICALPSKLLPDHGVMAELDGMPVAAAMMYFASNADLAFLAWQVTNPAVQSFEAANALDQAVLACRHWAKDNKVGTVLAQSSKPSMTAALERCGFMPVMGKSHVYLISDSDDLKGT